MVRHRAVEAAMLGLLIAACTSNPSIGPTVTDAGSQAPATSFSVSPTPSVIPCTPGAVTRFVLPSPNDVDILTGLAAFSSRDAWAVGEQFTGQDGPVVVNRFSLTEHWDGSSWSMTNGPDTGRGALLVSASGTTSDDVWAVGAYE